MRSKSKKKNFMIPNKNPNIVMVTWCRFGDDVDFFEQPIVGWFINDLSYNTSDPIEYAVPVLFDGLHVLEWFIHDKISGCCWSNNVRYSCYDDAVIDITTQELNFE
jgi:hypothetical protein